MLSPRNDNSGVTGALPYDPIQYTTLSACSAVAWIFAIELITTLVVTSNARTGCYFWSLIIASTGCIIHALGFVLKFLVGTSWVADMTFIGIGLQLLQIFDSARGLFLVTNLLTLLRQVG